MNNVTISKEDYLYAVHLLITRCVNIKIGKLGTFNFKPGIYIYVGSAKRNLRARIERHLALHKNKHWHFDYLRPFGEVIKVETFNNPEGECQLCAKIVQKYNGEFPVARFGSSDCNCESHLIYFSNN